MKITHALTATDLNPVYTNYIPVFIRTWLGLFEGRIQPVIVLLADELPAEWQGYREYIRLFPPLPRISTAFQAQCIRLLYPAMVDLGKGAAEEAEGVLITDMDIVPMNVDFYEQRPALAAAPPDGYHFVSFNSEDKRSQKQIQICYNVGTPAAWGEIFGIDTCADIERQLEAWYASLPHYDGRPGYSGWYADQEFLFGAVMAWLDRDHRNTLGLLSLERELQRLDRSHLESFSSHDQYRQLPKLVQDHIRAGFYTDYHMVRANGGRDTLNDSIIDLLLSK